MRTFRTRDTLAFITLVLLQVCTLPAMSEKLIQESQAMQHAADKLARHGQHRGAVELYTTVLEQEPDSAKAYAGRGGSYVELGSPEKGIADCTKAIELNALEPTAYVNRMAAYTALQQYDKALADGAAAIRIDPEKSRAYSVRGTTYAKMGDNKSAATDYSKAIELDPDERNLYYFRAYCYELIGAYDQALRDRTRITEFEPKNADAYYYKAVDAVKTFHFADAFQDYLRALALNPSQYWMFIVSAIVVLAMSLWSVYGTCRFVTQSLYGRNVAAGIPPEDNVTASSTLDEPIESKFTLDISGKEALLYNLMLSADCFFNKYVAFAYAMLLLFWIVQTYFFSGFTYHLASFYWFIMIFPNMLAAMVFVILIPLNSWLLYSRNQHKFHNIDVQIDRNGLTSNFTQAGFEQSMKWEVVSKVYQRGPFIFLEVSRIPMICWCIPKRNFPSKQEAENFYQLARKYWREAKLSSKTHP
jgi:tetratricopeptide (TPR) repeat protein